MKTDKIINQLKIKFPELWLKDGEEFQEGAILWSGEEAKINGWPAFDFWRMSDEYVCGVHPELEKETRKLGLYWEFYDGGTVLAYKL